MQQILHQSAGSRCLEAYRHTALLMLLKLPHCALIWLPYPAPGEKQLNRTYSVPKTQDMTPAAIEMACAVQELSFNRAPEICFRLPVRSFPGNKKTHPDESECVLAGAVGLEPTTNGFGDRDSTN